MEITSKKLASRLLYLPLDLNEKVLLWLTYRGLKPVSEITVERRNLPLLRRMLRKGIKIKSSYDKNSKKIRRVEKWIRDSGLYYIPEPEYPSSWHIGKDKKKVILSTKILHKFDHESEYQTGILFGFPKESARAYAHNRVTKNEKKQIPMISPFQSNPYAFYAIRADRIKRDSQVAVSWARTVRKEIPTLAKWFENYQKK